MKRKNNAIFCSFLALSLLLASCSNLFGPKAAAGAKAGYGSFTVSVPVLAPWIKASAKAQARGLGGPAARAFAVADSATFVVRQGSTVIDTFSASPSVETLSAVASPAITPPTGHETLAAGAYTLDVTIFNAAVSATVPVVAGSAAFTIVSGSSTDVAVTCLPAATITGGSVAITEGTILTDQTFGTPWVVTLPILTAPSVTSHGGEKWFNFVASSAYTQVSLTPAASSNAVPVFAVFNSVGEAVDIAFATQAGQAAGLGFASSAGGTYYIAALDLGGTSAATNRKVDISVTAATAPAPSEANRLLSYSLWIGSTEYRAFIDQYNEVLTLASMPAGTALAGLKATFTLSSGATLTTYDTSTGVQVNDAANTLTADYTVYEGAYHSSLYVYDASGAHYRTYWIYIPMADQNYITAFSVAGGTTVITEDSYGTSTIQVTGLPAAFDLATAAPTITVSGGATVSPDTGVATDFSSGFVTYTVTSAAGTRDYRVVLLKANAEDLVTAFSAVVGGEAYVGTIDQASQKIFLGPVPFAKSDLGAVPAIFALSAGASVTVDSSTTPAISAMNQDFSGSYMNLYLTPASVGIADGANYTKVYRVYLEGDK
jgi:hypothetical protein